MNGIPRKYRGRLYRSGLEAKWAAFMDRLGWRYEYEAFELPGWIPDFLLLGASPVLVEVKPVADFPADVAAEIARAAAVGECGYELLIVGVAPLAVPRFSSPSFDWQLGWLGERHDGAACWGDAPMGSWLGSDRPGFCHADGSWRDRITGRHDRCIGGLGAAVDINAQWTMAANDVQWRSPA